MKKIIMALALVVGFLAVGASAPALAQSNDTPCFGEPTIIEAVPAIWAVFSPNNNEGPFVGPPLWPDDDRGTWQVQGENIPGGHAGSDGVYQMGGGNSSWFYRQNAVPEREVPNEVPCPDPVDPVDPVDPIDPVDPVDPPAPPQALPETGADTTLMAILAALMTALGGAAIFAARRRSALD